MPILNAERILTVEEFLALPQSELSMELVDGEVVVSPRPRTYHQIVCLEVGYHLRANIGKHGQVIPEKELVVRAPDGRKQVRCPDLMLVRKSNLGIISQEAVRGVPDIIVEVLSPGNEEVDRITKRNEYPAMGVPEYWIVDIEDRAVLIHHFKWGSQAIYSGKNTLSSKLLEELGVTFEVAAADLFEVLN